MYKKLIASGMFLTIVVNAAPFRPGDEYKGIKLDKTRNAIQAVLPVAVTVNENKVIKPFSKNMLGYNHNWRSARDLITTEDGKISEEYLKTLKGAALPLNRMSGTGSQYLRWKWNIGPQKDRKPQKLARWEKKGTVSKSGPVEWVKSTLMIDKNAAFTWTFNMAIDSPQDAADLVEFLTGDPAGNPGGGINWAAKRVEYGLKDPVNIAVWELGNEMDICPVKKFTIEQYTAKCKAVIAAVRKIDPEAEFAAHTQTAWGTEERRQRWLKWNRTLLKELGNKLSLIVFHTYYHGHKPAYIEKLYLNELRDDLQKYPHLKLFLSEHAMWPPVPKNFTFMSSFSGEGLKAWKKNWYQTHALIGCLATAEWINRMFNRPEIAMMTYHCFCGGPWGAIYRDKKSKKLYTTGILDMFNLLCSAGGKDIVESTAVGKLSDAKRSDLTFTVSAITTKEGLVLILNNREPKTKRAVSFDFKGKYSLRQSEVFSAPSLHSYDTVSSKPIKITKKTWNLKTPFKKYTVPAKSLVILRLKRIAR
jgi:alpha-L-arabinofuranosidase